MTQKPKDPKPKAWQQHQNSLQKTEAIELTIAAPRQSYGSSTREYYAGQELAPYTGRPGAMRAYALPSLVAGTSTPRKAPACVPCVK
jgi:hypothetical protein